MTIDSGLTYMGVPTYINDIMNKNKIGVSGECDPGTQLGNITLVIGGDNYHMTPSDWQFMPEFKEVNSTAGKVEKKLMCSSTLMELNLMKDLISVGNRFMRRLYTVYDRDHDRIGLAHSSTV